MWCPNDRGLSPNAGTRNLTDRMRIRNVVNLFGDRKSGEGSGEGAPATEEGQPKAGRA
jgi:hypothetical protein